MISINLFQGSNILSQIIYPNGQCSVQIYKQGGVLTISECARGYECAVGVSGDGEHQFG